MQPKSCEYEHHGRRYWIDLTDREDNGSIDHCTACPTRMNLGGLGGTILAGLFLVGIPSRRRRWMGMIVLLWIVVAAGAIGCGGGRSSSSSGGFTTPATTAGTYRFSVTGADSANSSVTASASVAVNVQ
jgi:hypothetical protein